MKRKLIIGDKVVGGEPKPTPPTGTVCSSRSPMDDWCVLLVGHHQAHHSADGSRWSSGGGAVCGGCSHAMMVHRQGQCFMQGCACTEEARQAADSDHPLLNGIRCPDCTTVFDDWLVLRDHRQATHPDSPNFYPGPGGPGTIFPHRCPECQDAFTTSGALFTHMHFNHPQGSAGVPNLGFVIPLGLGAEEIPIAPGHVMAESEPVELRGNDESTVQCPICGLVTPHSQHASHLQLAHHNRPVYRGIPLVEGEMMTEESMAYSDSLQAMTRRIVQRVRYGETVLEMENIYRIDTDTSPLSLVLYSHSETTYALPLASLVQPVRLPTTHPLPAMFCEHANEVPAACHCPSNCSCRDQDTWYCRVVEWSHHQAARARAMRAPALPLDHPPAAEDSAQPSGTIRDEFGHLFHQPKPPFMERVRNWVFGPRRPPVTDPCECGHGRHSHRLDRTGNEPEVCVSCQCIQYRYSDG